MAEIFTNAFYNSLKPRLITLVSSRASTQITIPMIIITNTLLLIVLQKFDAAFHQYWRAGDVKSGGSGRPWATSQKEQRRVHTSPRIMNVAVPLEKHSWMFGQVASSHTVTNCRPRSFAFSSATAFPAGKRTRIHGGLRRRGLSASNFAVLRAILSAPTSGFPESLMGILSVGFSIWLRPLIFADRSTDDVTITQEPNQAVDQTAFNLVEPGC